MDPVNEFRFQNLTPDQIVAIGLALGGKSLATTPDQFIEDVAAKVVRVVRTDDQRPVDDEAEEQASATTVETPAVETPATPPAKEPKTRAPRGTRKTNAEQEAAAKTAPVESTRGGRGDDDDEEEERRSEGSPAGTMIEKLAELSEKFIKTYVTDEKGNKALTKRLLPYGVNHISEVAPGDRSAVIEMLKDELAAWEKEVAARNAAK